MSVSSKVPKWTIDSGNGIFVPFFPEEVPGIEAAYQRYASCARDHPYYSQYSFTREGEEEEEEDEFGIDFGMMQLTNKKVQVIRTLKREMVDPFVVSDAELSKLQLVRSHAQRAVGDLQKIIGTLKKRIEILKATEAGSGSRSVNDTLWYHNVSMESIQGTLDSVAYDTIMRNRHPLPPQPLDYNVEELD